MLINTFLVKSDFMDEELNKLIDKYINDDNRVELFYR